MTETHQFQKKIMNYFQKIFLLSILIIIINQTALFAHSGHGETAGHSLLHYLTEPMHAVILGAVVLIIAVSTTWLILKMKKMAKARA